MPDRPSFPIPEELTPDTYCLCIPIPNDPIWKAVISGLLFQPAEWFNWQRDEDRSGKVLAQYWRNIYNNLDWTNMSCCCPEPEPIIIRITSNGTYETSTDGGVTWTPDPSVDPRHAQPVFPPYPGVDEDNAKCRYADSIVQTIKTGMVDILDEASTISTIIGAIVAAFGGVLGILAIGIVEAIVVAVMVGIAAAIVGISIPAFKAAMTSDVYDRLRCNLYNHMNGDGTFSAAGKDAVYAQIGADETGLAMSFLQGVIAAAGEIGLSNMAHTGLGEVDADCHSCSDNCVAKFSIGVGTFVSSDENSITVDAVVIGDGRYAININTGIDNMQCCTLVSTEVISGDTTLGYNAQECGSDELFGGIIIGHCVHLVLILGDFGGSAYRMKFTFAPC